MTRRVFRAEPVGAPASSFALTVQAGQSTATGSATATTAGGATCDCALTDAKWLLFSFSASGSTPEDLLSIAGRVASVEADTERVVRLGLCLVNVCADSTVEVSVSGINLASAPMADIFPYEAIDHAPVVCWIIQAIEWGDITVTVTVTCDGEARVLDPLTIEYREYVP